MLQTEPSNHIFIAYSRSDKDFVTKLIHDLKASGFTVWIDVEGVSPGTPNWQLAIRTAVKQAVAVLLIATPDSAQSVFVHAELELARHYKRPIYPIWAAGEEYIESVPLEMALTQYIDCRSLQYDGGFTTLTRSLEQTQNKVEQASTPDALPNMQISETISNQTSLDAKLDKIKTSSHLSVVWSKNQLGVQHCRELLTLPRTDIQTVDMFLPAYETLQKLLDGLYMRHLSDRYEVYSYGSEWLLATLTSPFSRLIVPWDWMTERYSLNAHDRLWAADSLEFWGIKENTELGIIDRNLSSLLVFGLATADQKTVQFLQTMDFDQQEFSAALDAALLGHKNKYHLKRVRVSEFNPSDFKYGRLFVLSTLQQQKSGDPTKFVFIT